MKPMIRVAAAVCLALSSASAMAQVTAAQIDSAASKVEARVITWRRDIHQHPELSNRETRTSKLVADHLKKLGLPVRTGKPSFFRCSATSFEVRVSRLLSSGF